MHGHRGRRDVLHRADAVRSRAPVPPRGAGARPAAHTRTVSATAMRLQEACSKKKPSRSPIACCCHVWLPPGTRDSASPVKALKRATGRRAPCDRLAPSFYLAQDGHEDPENEALVDSTRNIGGGERTHPVRVRRPEQRGANFAPNVRPCSAGASRPRGRRAHPLPQASLESPRAQRWPHARTPMR